MTRVMTNQLEVRASRTTITIYARTCEARETSHRVIMPRLTIQTGDANPWIQGRRHISFAGKNICRKSREKRIAPLMMKGFVGI